MIIAFLLGCVALVCLVWVGGIVLSLLFYLFAGFVMLIIATVNWFVNLFRKETHGE